MRDPSDYFYLYYITFISISSLIGSIFYDTKAREELQLFKEWIKKGVNKYVPK